MGSGEGEEEGYYNENWTTDKPTTRYWYDGQMPCSEDFTRKIDGVTTVDQTQYGLGARGIDYIRVSRGSTVLSESYPIYDGHGNMIAQIDKSGTLANQRLYDVWGGVRSGSSTGEPSQRYCANLGHKQDDESGLIYMRARYYEPGTGRFISEDPSRADKNWYQYCDGDPVNHVDKSGKDKLDDAIGVILLMTVFVGGTFGVLLASMSVCLESAIVGGAGLIFLVSWFAGVKGTFDFPSNDMSRYFTGLGWVAGGSTLALSGSWWYLAAHNATLGATGGKPVSPTAKIIAVIVAYSSILLLFMELECALNSVTE